MVVQRALISVFDKTGIVEFAKRLVTLKIEILSTGGTAKLLRESGIAVRDVSDFTGWPEMLGGRVKTLHPKVHGGLLFRRGHADDQKQATEHGIAPIDLVVVNLYPFEATAAKAALTADDLIAALTPRTRVVSISHVRFDDGSLLDVLKLAEACHQQGTLVLVDVSQSCGAVPMDVTKLGADFMVCAGYKWLLGAFGTGFFWVKSELISKLRVAPFYWMAVAGSDNFAKLDFANPKPAESAKRWDTPEWASHFNFNLAALDASVEFVLRATPEVVAAHNHMMIDSLFARLPVDRCIAASPLDRSRRGPYGCFVARTPEKTAELYQKLREQNVYLSLRESKLRVSPYLFNTIQDIDRLVSVITP